MTQTPQAHGAEGALTGREDPGSRAVRDRSILAGWWILPSVLGGIVLWTLALGSLWAWLL
jgi:hypothetical protein